MAENLGVIKAVLVLYRLGFSYVAIARTLNISIAKVSEIINEHN
jgi:hypothetical protein